MSLAMSMKPGGLEQVPETMEWSEYTPTGNHKNPNFTSALEE